jgi:DMSO/TMAO reductase YedYZ molybdopterin-dependent catalytic subunit
MHNRNPESHPASLSNGAALLSFVAGGALASAVAAGTMTALRASFQVRTIPERLLEWMLVFVPLDVFEAGLQRFGFDAKRYAFYGTIVIMFLALTALGAVVLKRSWSTRALGALGLGLWLGTMAVIMPVTGAGFFGSALPEGRKAALGGYLAAALLYVGALALIRAYGQRPWPVAARGSAVEGQVASRREALAILGAGCAVYATTVAATLWGPRTQLTRVVVLDPQEPVPSGGIEVPGSHPHEAATQQQALASATTPVSLTDPPPARQIPRDKDGAVLPSGRRPGELADYISSNDDFYIVSKNAVTDPWVRAADWRLVVDGEVQRTFQLNYASLRNLPAVEINKTLECISNFTTKCELAPFGCDLISTARWKGVPLRDVLDLAGGLKPGVVSLAVIGADEFTTALPIEVALAADTLLVYGMNGQALPMEHGYPARVLIPGRYGMKSAKWVVALRALRRDFLDWYGQRNWSKDAIVKTMTRIDVPAPNEALPPGTHRIAGIAYAGDRGVAKVEFSADGGQSWQTARFIEAAAGRDMWVRWQGTFTMPPTGDITLVARATDRTGELQIDAFSLPQPDGGTGWHTTEVRAQRV